MDRGDGFWTSPSKGWKTRRDQQDAYRRALDQQIEERKKMEQQRKGKTKAEEAPKIQDPVQHLMPWLTQPPSDPQNAPIPRSMPTYVPPTSYYYMANPTTVPSDISPVKGNLVELQTQTQTPPQPYPFYGSLSIPPPPAYLSAAYLPSSAIQCPPQAQAPFVMMPPPSGYSTPQQGLTLPTHPHPPPFHHGTVPPPVPTPSSEIPKPSETLSKPMSPISQPEQEQEADHTDTMHQHEHKEANKKVHVSQTAEELREVQSSMEDEYRRELARQVKEKRRMEEERQKKEQEEEERFQRKLQHEQERLQRQYEEEMRENAAKEEEVKRRTMEHQKRMEFTEKKLRQEAEMNKTVQQRKERHDEAVKNSQHAFSSSPSRYYHHDTSWPWESTPVPTTMGTEVSTEKSRSRDRQRFVADRNQYEGSGDAPDKFPFSTPISSRSPGQSLSSPRSLFTKQEIDDLQNITEEPESASSSKTYSLPEPATTGMEMMNHPGSGPGTSRSVEEVNPTNVTGEVIVCPKCCKSFSASDVQFPKTPAERQKILNCLDNIQRRLREDRERLLGSGFDWQR